VEAEVSEGREGRTMARANRHHIPGCIWHLTHRCHKKEFLLKLAHDRARYVLREEPEPYEINFTPDNRAIGPNVCLLVGGFS